MDYKRRQEEIKNNRFEFWEEGDGGGENERGEDLEQMCPPWPGLRSPWQTGRACTGPAASCQRRASLGRASPAPPWRPGNGPPTASAPAQSPARTAAWSSRSSLWPCWASAQTRTRRQQSDLVYRSVATQITQTTPITLWMSRRGAAKMRQGGICTLWDHGFTSWMCRPACTASTPGYLRQTSEHNASQTQVRLLVGHNMWFQYPDNKTAC